MGFADMAREALRQKHNEKAEDKQDAKKAIPSCFDPDGILQEVIGFWQDRDNGNESCIEHISQMIADGMLKSPWGFLVRSGHIGDYWIISDTTAREKLPVDSQSFTIEELRPIIKTCKVLNGKVVEVKYRASIPKEAVNA